MSTNKDDDNNGAPSSPGLDGLTAGSKVQDVEIEEGAATMSGGEGEYDASKIDDATGDTADVEGEVEVPVAAAEAGDAAGGLSSATSKDEEALEDPDGGNPEGASTQDQEMEPVEDTAAAASDDQDQAPIDDAGSSDGKVEESAANDTATEDGSSKDLPYSTRGRSTGSASGEEKSSDRPVPKETFDELPKSKDASLGISFLESLTEEERRTRTRIIPDVEGMHMLRKHEIKDDLALARSLPAIATSQSKVQTRTVRLSGAAGRKKDAMVIDGEDAAMLIQDNRTVTIPLPTNDITVPSDAFVAPDGVKVGEAEGTIAVTEVSKKEPVVHSPSVVESVTAFNPPRPPESVGPKKKHRVIRWERRPEDIEVDMKNYRRTVQRTREELQKSESEYNRLETIDAHLRRHFLNHLELMNEEYTRLHDEMQIEVQKLMKESELVGSRTRSRNLTKVSVVMRDVLSNLNNTATPMTDASGSEIEVPSTAVPGIGGLNAEAFSDWDRFTVISPMKPAISWLVPGQKVSTPYGDGVVDAVFPPEFPQPSTGESEAGGGDGAQRGTPENMKNAEFQKTSNRKAGGAKSLGTGDDDKLSMIEQEHSKYKSLKPARVQVRMPYGMGIFGLEAVLRVESPAKYNDSQLALRWKGMVDTALKVGPCIDLPGMASRLEKESSESPEDVNSDSMPMDIDEATKSHVASAGSTDTAGAEDDSFVPTGASLMPTKGGRGNYFDKMSIVDVEKGLQEALYDGFGVLGDVSQSIWVVGFETDAKNNPGVTKEIREWEDDEQEYLTLRASVLQLKNVLYRQRRIRILNERTSVSMDDRYQRAEELVSEMRSDLKSLKHRLEEELSELGIAEETMTAIFSQFYKGQDEDDKGDASTPKRLRRASSVSREMLAGVDLSTMETGGGEGGGDARDSTDNDLSGDDMEDRPAKKVRTGQ
ncbi:MAG: hypothetical protein SGILL_004384 [Bacillariaceae sp.]